MINSNQLIKTPQEEGVCSQDCYTQCGNIYNEDNIDKGEHVLLRFFYLKLSDLPKFVGSKPKQVLVHAQTVLIDSDVYVDYALLIHARQIILNRNQAFTISVSSSAPDLDINTAHTILNGPYPDLLHQKLSYMCARILLEEKVSTSNNLAWAILREISESSGDTREQRAFIASTRTYIGELVGLSRSDIHYVPQYTKSHLVEILDTYYKQIYVYKNDYDRLLDSTTSDTDFISYSEKMHNIYSDTDLKEAEDSFETTIKNIHAANASYTRIRVEYEHARDQLEIARKVFEEGIVGAPEPTKQGMLGYMEGIINVVYGYINGDWFQIIKGIEQIRNNTAG